MCTCNRNLQPFQWMLFCKCEEDPQRAFAWQFSAEFQDSSTNNSKIEEAGRLACFNQHYSLGTSIIRGSQILSPNSLHFWEVKVISPIYGKDMMIGVADNGMNLQDYSRQYTSAIGNCEHSWGFSVYGYIVHAGQRQNYAPSDEASLNNQHQGCLILGCLWNGLDNSLRFYRNKHCLGIAFRNVHAKVGNLYPMVCSTAARTGMRLIRAESFPITLELLCMLKLAANSHLWLWSCNYFPRSLLDYLQFKYSWLNGDFHKNSHIIINNSDCISAPLAPPVDDLFVSDDNESTFSTHNEEKEESELDLYADLDEVIFSDDGSQECEEDD